MSALIGTKNPREYDQAVTLLKDLEALGQREGNAEAFAKRFRQLRDQHLRKPSRLDRFDKAGLQLISGTHGDGDRARRAQGYRSGSDSSWTSKRQHA